jgi:hypothetical protein
MGVGGMREERGVGGQGSKSILQHLDVISSDSQDTVCMWE